MSVPWGASGASVGRRDGNESAPEGPMSFAVHPGGDVTVLDQVNGRLARFDASSKLVAETPLPATTFQELALVDGGTVLLDRLARRSLLVLDALGQHVREVPVEGPGIPEGGAVTALLVEPDGVWLEVGHLERVRVLDARLLPGDRRSVRGRPWSADRHLLGAIDRQGAAALWLEDGVTGNVVQRADVTADRPIARIVWLERDAAGSLHAIFHLVEPAAGDPAANASEGLLGIRYDDALDPVASWRSLRTIALWEQFREVRILDDGTAYQMVLDDGGMAVLRWTWAP